MSNAWFSPVSGAINQMDALRNPNPHRTDGSVIDEPPAARNLAVATASGAPIQRLSEHLLFAIFDFVRDGHAFVQSEASCRAFCGLLQSTEGIGRKLWEARPIRYGYERPIPMPHDENPRLPYMQPPDFFLKAGGRRVVLEFAALQSLDLRRNIVNYVAEDIFAQGCLDCPGPVWTQTVTQLAGAATGRICPSRILRVPSKRRWISWSRGSRNYSKMRSVRRPPWSSILLGRHRTARSILDDTTMPHSRALHVSQAK